MENSTIESSNWRVLTVKFPDDAHMTIQSIPEAQLPRFSEKVLGRQGLLTVKYKPGTRATIYGFGLPFSNPGHPADGWFNRDEPMVASLTLREFLEQSVFTMVVGRVPGPAHLEKVIKEATLSPFTYPYGRDHMWDVTRYVTPDGPASGTKFALRQSFDDDNSHVAVLTQSVAQDQIWVAHEAAKLFATKVHAYLVPEHEGSAEPASYFAIVAFTDELRAKFELLWKAISKPDARLSLAFHKDMAPIDPPSIEGISEWKKLTQAQWMAKMRNHPASIPVLKDHPVKEGELVFQVRVDRRPGNAVDVKMWPSREVADSRLSQDEHSWHVVSIFFDADLSDARRKVEAACLLLPDASPVNPKACNGDIGFCMELQRDLFRGNGFHRALSAADATWEQDLVNAMASTHVNEDTAIKDAAARIRRIPIVDLFKVPRDYLVALKENILPEDCSRFTEYFSTRPLGLGIITAVSKLL